MDYESDYAAIREVFEDFIKAWETGAATQIDNCMISDPIVDMSMFSIMYSREAFKQALTQSGAPNCSATFDIHNYVCLIDGCMAQQCAAMFGIFTKQSGESSRHYTFSGQFANQFVKCGDGWKLSQVRFDLLDDDCMTTSLCTGSRPVRSVGSGDFSLTAGWRPICSNTNPEETRVIPRVCGELHSPWSIIKRERCRPDEEQICELFYRWAFAVDCNTTALLVDILAEDMVVSIDGVDYDRGSIIRKLKSFQLWMGGRYQHVAQFDCLTVQGDTAQACVLCRSPGMVMQDDPEEDIWCARCVFSARKTQDGWQMTDLHYQFGTFATKHKSNVS